MMPEGEATTAARLTRAACISAPVLRALAITGVALAVLLTVTHQGAQAQQPGVAMTPAPVAPAMQTTPAAPAALVPAAPAAPVVPVVPAAGPPVAPVARPAVPVPPTSSASRSTGRSAIVNPDWKTLSPLQQQALAPLATEWDHLDTLHKSKWLEISRKFVTMKPDEQVRVQERMRAWIALTPDQRRVARESYARTKKLNTDQKSEQWQQYQQLPDDQKKKLAAEAAKNKVATLPPAHSKAKTVPPIKSVHKPLLQQSVMPQDVAGNRSPERFPRADGAASAPAIAPTGDH